jgi:hypothetical protein
VYLCVVFPIEPPTQPSSFEIGGESDQRVSPQTMVFQMFCKRLFLVCTVNSERGDRVIYMTK